MALRLLLIDDHPLFRAGIASMLVRLADEVCVEEVSSVLEALDRLEEAGQAFSLILYDWHLPDGGGVLGLTAIRQAAPAVPVLVMSGDEEKAVAMAAVQLGAKAFVLKSASPDAMRDAVLSALSCLSAAVLPAEATTRQSRRAVALTVRQRDVLQLLAEGRPNKRIADALGIAETTVRAHVSEVLRALGAANRTQAAVMASEARLIDRETPAQLRRRLRRLAALTPCKR